MGTRALGAFRKFSQFLAVLSLRPRNYLQRHPRADFADLATGASNTRFGSTGDMLHL